MNRKKIIALIASMLLLSSCGKAPGFTVGKSDAPDETSSGISDLAVQAVQDEKTQGSEFTPVEAEPYDYATNDLTPFITVGQYNGLEVTLESSQVTDEELEDALDDLVKSYSYFEEITDRETKEGDIVIADYSGYLDGVQFGGGTATNQTIITTPDSGYIPGFAEAFVGRAVEEEFDFNVTFPEDYGNTDLAGKEVTFVCTIHSIRSDKEIIPELTDEFVNEKFGYNNTEEFKIAYRSTLEQQKEYYVRNNMYNELWQKIMLASEVKEYPGQEVDRVYGERRTVYEQYAATYNLDYEAFLKSYANLTDEELYADCRNYVKEDLVMNSLIKELDISLSDEEYENESQVYADMYGMTVEDMYLYYGEEAIKTTILWTELLETIAETAVIN